MSFLSKSTERSRLYALKAEHKLLPIWSTPRWVATRHLNSLHARNFERSPLPRLFSTRRLRIFLQVSKEGTMLAEEQRLIEEHQAREVPETARGVRGKTANNRARRQNQRIVQPPASGLGNEGVQVATKRRGTWSIHTSTTSYRS